MTETTNKVARPRTYLNFILDESDSMKDSPGTVSAFNEFLSGQRYARIDELFVTLTLFSSAGRVRTAYTCVPIDEVQPLTDRVYRPQGMTALYDGIVHSLRSIDKKVGRGDRVINVLLTDGDENDSERVTLRQLLGIKREFEARGNWSFVYLGTGTMAWAAASKMGFKPGNTDVYTEGDVTGAIVRINENLKSYRQADDLSTDAFHHPAKRWSRPQWATGPAVVLTDDE
jgi:hypothetical protein